MKDFILFLLKDISLVLKIETEKPRLRYFCQLYSSAFVIVSKYTNNQYDFTSKIISLFNEYLQEYNKQKINSVLKLVNDTIKKIDSAEIEL